MAGTLGEVWKIGTAIPDLADIPEGGLAIDKANKKAYSSTGSEIFEIGGSVSAGEGDQNIDGGRADTNYGAAIEIDGGGA